MDLKKAYYYIICLAAILIFSWGLVDLAGSAAGLVANRTAAVAIAPLSVEQPLKESEPYLDLYYQKRALYDRLWDSLARLVVAGAIFTYSRRKVEKNEK